MTRTVGQETILRAGAHSVDISPTRFPVIVNGMFTERTANKVVDALFAKALVLDDGSGRLALCVVDTCMMPRDLIDRAKQLASGESGIPVERMLVSATHTHSAPAAMGCLGSRVDPEYAAALPAWIAEAIVAAAKKLGPARIGWTVFDDWDHTFNRRWIRRPDKILTDPFGQPTMRAHMHPGHESPDAVGPSGPVDPGVTVIAVATPRGKPLAVFANYSQHYYSSPLLSSDYFGRFARYVAEGIGAGENFVGIMSQGTSGDLAWIDYGSPARDIGYDAYARAIAARVVEAYRGLEWQSTATLRAAERNLPLRVRVPDAARLEWARGVTNRLAGRLPQSLPEIYAWEAIHLHERPRTELKLQALRIGDVAVAAIPNEVYAITGLKLKQQSPLPITMNVSLANGAEGYIPPPEQHKLGGYTTWPARTAGLEVDAETKIVATLLDLLEDVTDRPRRQFTDDAGPYTRAVLQSDPMAFWRLNEIDLPSARDATAHRRDARFEDGIALYLPGAGSGTGILPNAALKPSNFSGRGINRAVHMAGGRLRGQLPLGENYTIELWLWNGLAPEVRAVTAYLFSRGADGDPLARGEHLGIGGTYRADLTGRLFLFNGNERNEVVIGRTVLEKKAWHHVAFVREGRRVRVHLDGNVEPEIDADFEATVPAGETTVFLGGRNDKLFGLEGRLDEVAVYARALPAPEIVAHYAAAALAPPATRKVANAPASLPIPPEESLQRIHVPAGYQVQLAAAEPLTLDPVAIDWDAAGRLWVAEMADYPLGLDGKGKAGGRVRVLEDTNRDGRYDKATLFAEELNFPTGVLTWRDGVIVTAAPEIIFLRDTNNDGRADRREVLVSGLQEGNQQLRVNGLRWGLDNWVYCAAGGHHGNYGVGTRVRTRAGEVLVGSRDFRFRPDSGELEPQSGPSQFGRNRDDWGRWFGTQNIRPLWHYVLADHYLRRNQHVPAPDPTRQVVVPLSPKVFPASPQEKRYHSFNEAGHFTSACEGMIYRDELLFPDQPPGEENAFTCEPFHNLVQRNVVTNTGVSFAAGRAGDENHDFFASEDRWCRPVMTRTGPDGALWVVDMYRYMIEHPDWLPKEGRDELLPHYRLGDDRGRIYRVVPENGARKPLRLDRLAAGELVGALDSPNGWQRDKVHQLLIERAEAAAVAPLQQLARTSRNALARLHALCVLDGLVALTPDLVLAGLHDTHSGVRENAVRLAEKHRTPELMNALSQMADDPSAKVRLQLAFSLGEWADRPAGDALGRLAVSSHHDHFMLAAVMSSAVPHCRALTDAVVAAGGSALGTLSEPLAKVALGLNDRETLAVLLRPLLTPNAAGAFSLEQVTTFTRLLGTMTRRQGGVAELARGSDALATGLREMDALVQWSRQRLNAEAEIETRTASAQLLVTLPETRSDALHVIAGWLDPRHPGELQRGSIRVLSLSGDASVATTVLSRLAGFSPETAAVAVKALLTREEWILALLRHGESHGLPPLDATQRDQLLKHSSARVRQAASKLMNASPDRAGVVKQFDPALKLTGDEKRGSAIFARLCVSCHVLNGVGSEIGPDLRSVANHPPSKLLASILDPSADIQPGYQAYHGEMKDGAELYGLIVAETGNSLTFKLTDGSTRSVLRRDLVTLRNSNLSLMPEGLETGMSHQEMADLIQFVRAGLPMESAADARGK